MAGRPVSTQDYFKILLRLPPALQARVEHCHALLQRQHGPKFTQTQALWHLLETGCAALEGREIPAPISEISEISSRSISKISEISGEDIEVPGYGFPEDEEEIPAPASHTNGTRAPAPQPPTQPAIPLALEPAPTTAPPVDVPQAAETRTAKTPAQRGLPRETLQAIADERTQCEGLTIRAFSQRLYDKGIYRAKGDKPAESGWLLRQLNKAREAGLL